MYAPAVARADRIVLRNLDVLNDVTVAGLDENGVRLDGGRTLRWDEIESGAVAAQQQKFDMLLESLGDHLYRIRQRLAAGEERDLAEHAEAVFPRYTAHRSETASMVFHALFWSRLASQRRESALEAYLYCLDALSHAEADRWELPGNRRITFDKETGLSAALEPVWFDPAAARKALPRVTKFLEAHGDGLPRGVHVYHATLGLAAGEEVAAEQALARVEARTRPFRELVELAEAQRLVAAGKPQQVVERLGGNVESFLEPHRPLARYWLGRARLTAAEGEALEAAVLELLSIPALHGDEHAELAAAALKHAAEALAPQNPRAASRLRQELLSAWPETYHAALLRSRLRSGDDSKGSR
ncbi:MAG: hypothetical protein KY476_13065 [Planctomycetes bacterium]|nr:hypothetical protein [Planctomycetota bacterium]